MAVGKRKHKADEPRITPAKAKNAVAVAKVIGPAVLPVVTPYFVQAAGAVREKLDRRRARKLGVAVQDLSNFTGKGAALQARIAGAAEAAEHVRKRPDASEADRTFATESEATLEQLSAAVRAAETMPSSRRKAAHRAVGVELDQLEQRLLHRLGV